MTLRSGATAAGSGLSLNLNTNFESIRDQITLPAAIATTEEALVNQRQLAASYRYSAFGRQLHVRFDLQPYRQSAL